MRSFAYFPTFCHWVEAYFRSFNTAKEHQTFKSSHTCLCNGKLKIHYSKYTYKIMFKIYTKWDSHAKKYKNHSKEIINTLNSDGRSRRKLQKKIYNTPLYISKESNRQNSLVVDERRVLLITKGKAYTAVYTVIYFYVMSNTQKKQKPPAYVWFFSFDIRHLECCR